MKKFLVLTLLISLASTVLAGQDSPKTLNQEKAQIVEWFVAPNHQIMIEELPAVTENRTHKSLAQKDRKQDGKEVVAQTEKAETNPNTAP